MWNWLIEEKVTKVICTGSENLKEMKLFVTTSSPPPTRKQEGDQGELPNVVFATDNNYYSMIVAIVYSYTTKNIFVLIFVVL